MGYTLSLKSKWPSQVFHVVQCKFLDHASGLILVSPVAQCAS
uniref:Uncharacterized protein n=1 Tax=Physcomitrium patens TaxID=3218 RepID=A0A2K1JS11_PHYPA|nr:hypothetical protein PHYPA_016706 [Physcomitrium patens]